jgi:tetratricopeptide (TPR) repeat protein
MIIYEEAINSSIRIAVAEKNTVFAERMLTRAVDTVKLLRGKEHQDMGYIWRVHARYHLAIGRTGTADEEFQRGLQLVENALGSDHPRFYQFGITLGEFYLQIKQAAKAVIILTRVLKLQEQHPPADKTVFARTLYLVAAANLQNGCAADAVPYAARALALVDQCFGTESQMTVSYLQIYATVVKKSGREDEYSKIKPRLEAMHLQ